MSSIDAREAWDAHGAGDSTGDSTRVPPTPTNRLSTGMRVYRINGLTIRCNDQPFVRFHDVEINGVMILPKLSVSQYGIFRVLLQHCLQLAEGRGGGSSRAHVPLSDILSTMDLAVENDETCRLVQRQITHMRKKLDGYFVIGCATVGKHAHGYYLQPAEMWSAGADEAAPNTASAPAALSIVRTA